MSAGTVYGGDADEGSVAYLGQQHANSTSAGLAFEQDPELVGEFSTAYVEPEGDTSAAGQHIVDRDAKTGALTVSFSPPRPELTLDEAAEYLADLERVLQLARRARPQALESEAPE